MLIALIKYIFYIVYIVKIWFLSTTAFHKELHAQFNNKKESWDIKFRANQTYALFYKGFELTQLSKHD